MPWHASNAQGLDEGCSGQSLARGGPTFGPREAAHVLSTNNSQLQPKRKKVLTACGVEA
jgi:hypothetical protein